MSNKVLKDIIKTREHGNRSRSSVKTKKNLLKYGKSGRFGKRIFRNTPLPAAAPTNVVRGTQDSPYVDSAGYQEEEGLDFHSAEEDVNIDESSLETTSPSSLSSGNTPLLNNNNSSKNKKRFRMKKSLKRNIDRKGLKIEKNLKALNHLKREKKENAFQRRNATTTTPITIEQKKILKRKNSTPLDGFDDYNAERLKTSHIFFNQKRKSKSQLNTDKKRNKNINNSNDDANINSNKSPLYSVKQTLINNEKLDKIYGFNVDVRGNWRYGNNKLKFNRDNTINIGNIKWTMTPDSNSIDFHKKRLQKDAVTKAYLLRKNDVLADSVNNLTTTYTSKMNRIEDDMKQFQNSYNSQMNSMKKQIDELYTTNKNDINSEAKQVEITLKNQLINANKIYMNKIEERFDKI
uniref:Uncharacterized protein n=1 Tax=Glossina palpalis gambiensis TaxID=67801 RepID=A0A1B0BYA3_9MUSC